eukprot:CAMPEP_0170197898 /NCGR_PEP_ID=MMETSP0040_2-20121228/67499_1 /TAXON_ID=641309 /ORGANISM="Lotharella oceanica, Strain CCMP622" /LENGTH=139 /DNA_ID=CAMNT_0010447693 /DNA_START=9 /DNA_END=428 /DNA_ORIENTATION=+
MHRKQFYFVRRAVVDGKDDEDEEEEKVVPSPSEEARAKGSKYSTDKYKFIGCYHDKWNRDLPKGPRKWGYTPESCMAACDGFLYFALQGGSWCCCGNTYGKHGKAPEPDCLHKKNDKEEMLGGEFLNAIYEIAEKNNKK